jgi:hypothetical protein
MNGKRESMIPFQMVMNGIKCIVKNNLAYRKRERGREKGPELLFLFLKGMTGA